MTNMNGKENGPHYFNDANQQIWKAVDSYFANAGTDSYSNTRLIQPAIDKLGGAIILTGFSWVAEKLEQEGLEAAKAGQRGIPSAILTHNIIAVAKNSMNQLKDIVKTEGRRAGETLAASIGTATDEDESALTAYMLAENFAANMDPMPKVASRLFLEAYLDNIEGTSAKMAISWAIYKMGNKKPWEEMVYGNYFIKKEWIVTVEDYIKKNMPNLSQQENVDIICRECAVQGSTDFPGRVVLDGRGIFECLAMDIASDGQLFARSYPNWTRKAKG